MPKKSVREMSELERKHYSLAARIFHAAERHFIILGFICFLIGLGMYLGALMQDSMKEEYDTAHEIADAAKEVADPALFAEKTIQIYRAQHGVESDDEYYASFSEIITDPEYQKMLEVLRAGRTEEMSDFFFAVPDAERGSLIFVADTDPRLGHAYPTGRTQKVPAFIQRFFFSRGDGAYPHMYYFIPRRGVTLISGAYIREGDPSAGFLFTVTRVTHVLGSIRNFALQYVVAIIAAIAVMGYLYTRHMKKTLVEPINRIAGAAEAYIEDRRQGVQGMAHFSGLNIRTGDEVENLGLVMADMESEINDYVENLTQVTAEKERISTELSLATRIQAGMLPNIFPAFPDREEFDIYAVMDPAREVGGDFYDFFLIDDDHLCLIMADVSGKGVPAALFMMASKIILENNAMMGKSPAKILTDTNNAICPSNHEEMFVTVWLGILELSTGRLTASNAGHEYPAVMHAGGRFELLKDRHGFVIGGIEGSPYHDYELQLEPGARVFLYTDGVAEAMREDKEMFGTERMLEVLNRDTAATPEQMLRRMREAVDDFAEGAEQFDDLTMLCVHYLGPMPGGEDTVKELTMEATVENIPKVTAFVDAELEALDCPVKAQMQIDVAIDELFSNIAYYAYHPDTGPATVRVEVEEDPMAVVITFIDHGTPYDPLTAETPDVTLPAEERPTGGLGIFLVRKTMDDVSYEYKDGRNILKIKKHI